MIKYIEIKDYFLEKSFFSEEKLYEQLLKDLKTSQLYFIEDKEVRGGLYKVLSLTTGSKLEVRLEGETELIDLFKVYLSHKTNTNKVNKSKLKKNILKMPFGSLDNIENL